MRATHICGMIFEGPSRSVIEAVADHKERCLAEIEAHERTRRMSLHPSTWLPRLRP